MSTASPPLLVTGATGFLGAWIARRAAEDGRHVLACDLSEDRRRFEQIAPAPQVAKRIEWLRLDVTDPAAARALVLEREPSAIVHLAALQIPACAADPRLGARVNIEGHINIFDAARARGVPVIYASSAAAKPRGAANAPATLYGVYKQAGEGIARLYWRDHAVPSMGLRPYIVYGVGRDQGETSALTAAMQAAAEGRAYEIPFRGRFCFQYAADVADAFLRAAEAVREGAATSDMSSTLEPVEAVRDAIRAAVPDARITIENVSREGPSDFDTRPLDAIAPTRATTPLARGVAETVAAFRDVAHAAPALGFGPD